MSSAFELPLNDNPARYGESRHHQELFIPELLRKESLQFSLGGEAFDRAYAIIKKWAELEASGKLQKKKETTLESEFLTEIFGRALGYTLFSKGEAQWNLTPKFTVNGGIADAAIGEFDDNSDRGPVAVIELKGPTANLDRDRSQGRTAVQQCWDYLNALPECPWGIVCNYVSFRLYHRSKSNRAYQRFVLKDLVQREEFSKFYFLFQRNGLLPEYPGDLPRAVKLLKATGERQEQVGDELYTYYDANRTRLIHALTQPPHSKPLETAIRIAQKIIDRIIFVAFCEDRRLIPDNSIHRAYSEFRPFHQVTNPRWENFLQLFRSVDKGNKNARIPQYNGGLFAIDDDVDHLELDDQWTDIFERIGTYDFLDTINVDVLGHLFERSINDISRLKLGGLLGVETDSDDPSKMPKSAERKRQGVYYTPPDFTQFIVRSVVGKTIDDRIAELAVKRGIPVDEKSVTQPDPIRAAFWRECLSEMRSIKVVDPACGSGAFLIAAYEQLAGQYDDVIAHILFHDSLKQENLSEQIPDYILHENLYGVDLSKEAVGISQLALWIRSAREGKTLADLSQNIVHGNSLIADKEVHPEAMDWEATFPEVFNRPNKGFDCVIGNPPWERMKLQEREYFDAVAPEIATAVDAATRRKMVKELEKEHPDVHDKYLAAKDSAEKTLDYVRKSGRFPLTGKGDINTYAVFAELASILVARNGLVGLLVPSGIATDDTTKEFFGDIVSNGRLSALFDFENKEPVFPYVHRSFKFCILLFGGTDSASNEAEFAFFARRIADLRIVDKRISLTPKDIALVNPNTRTCPIFRTRRDAELTKAIYKRVPVLVNYGRKKGGNPWGVKFLRMFDQTNDAELFHTAEQLKEMKFNRDGAVWKKGSARFLPLYEAKMVQMYDHRAASVVVKDENWMRQGQTADSSLTQHQNPEFTVEPRWWVAESAVGDSIATDSPPFFVGFKDITSATNTRTMIASAIPMSGVTNHFPLILSSAGTRQQACLLGNLNSFVLDYATRQKVGAVTLNFFIVEQLPIFPPDHYDSPCQWHKKQTLEKWISDRVLKLTCTANDMIPLAEAAGFKPSVHKWKPEERAQLMAELDAAYFIMYGIGRDDVEYIISTFNGVEDEPAGLFGTKSTKELILHYYDEFRGEMKRTGFPPSRE